MVARPASPGSSSPTTPSTALVLLYMYRLGAAKEQSGEITRVETAPMQRRSSFQLVPNGSRCKSVGGFDAERDGNG